MTINLNLVSGTTTDSLDFLSNAIKQLPKVSLTLYANQNTSTLYQSRDFLKYTKLPYKMINVDPTLKFI